MFSSESDVKEIKNRMAQAIEKITQSPDPREMSLGEIIKEIIEYEKRSLAIAVYGGILKYRHPGLDASDLENKIRSRIEMLYSALTDREKVYRIHR